jgi:hypothetical protein
LAFWHFCRKHQRLPAGGEIERCKRDARGLDEGLVMLAKIEPNSLVTASLLKALAGLGRSMVAKGDMWSKETLGQ